MLKINAQFSLILFLIGVSVNAQFVHPGITHKKSDLDRMKLMVEAQIDPWYTSYQEMVSDSKSDYNYTVQGSTSFTEVGRDNKVNYNAWNSDIRAAYYNAIRWYIEGDIRHAEKAIEIFNSWVNIESVTSNGTMALSGGVAYIMIEAAEIIKHTYNGWSEIDRKKFEDMLVFPGYSNTAVPSGISTKYGSFYWQSYQGDSGRHGNQGLSGWRTVMAIGIFLDNQIIYDRALRYIKGLPHRSDDLPYPAGAPTSNSVISSNDYADTYSVTRGNSIEDYGYNEVLTNYIWENGQCQESSRDQAHTAFGLGLLTSMAEMAWNQGDNLYEYANSRLLLGLEYNMRYNVSSIQTYPDQPTAWNPTVASGEFIERFDRTGRWYSKAMSPVAVGDFSPNRPVFEMPLAHYLGRGIKTEQEVKWIKRARDKAIELSGYEVAGWTNDAIGWGGLTARRPDFCYGDPISGFDNNNLPLYKMHEVPDVIEAENFDYDPIKNGEGRTYHDLSSSNIGDEYRSFDEVDIEALVSGGYNITDIETGEWLSYTVSVPETAIYSFSIKYAASQTGGTIQLIAGGEAKTDNVLVPFGGANSTSNSDWKEYIVSNNIVLNKGVQSIKIMFGGTSKAFKLDYFKLSKIGIVKQEQTISFYTIPQKVVGSDDFTIDATTSSNLSIELSSSNTSVTTIVGNKVHIVGAGETTITAMQNGNNNYNKAVSVSRKLQVVNNVKGTVNIITSDDTYVNEGAANTNYGSDVNMVTKVSGRYVFLKFDLHSLPGPVISAKLRMYQRTGFRDTRSVFDVVDDSWTETELKWNNKPSFENERASITTNSTWNEWDVSSYVAQEYASDKVISMVIKDPADSGVGIDWRSKEYDSNLQPELVVEYSDTPLSIKSVELLVDFYPNPVEKYLNVSLVSPNLNVKTATLNLFDLQGKRVINIKIDSPVTKLNLSDINSGIYFLKINDSHTAVTKKIVKL